MFKIKKKEYVSKRHITSNDLEIGDIFLYEGDCYLKIAQYNVDDTDLGNGDFYCLKLDDSELYVFKGREPISIIDKEIIIDYTNEDLKEWCD